MYELKTKLNDASVADFINTVDDAKKKEESFKIIDIMTEISGEQPKMWGSSIVGFGLFRYQGKTCEGEWMKIGFSPRKAALTIYLSFDIEQYRTLLDQLGKHKTGKGCLYIKKLADIDENVLKNLIKTAYLQYKD